MKNIIQSYSRYQIVQKIASGGMGSVSRARLLGVEGFEKTVAIKTLLPRFASDEGFVRRFIAEAKLVATLVHENIVQVYQLDRVGDEYFYVQEFVDGISLFDFVEFHKAMQRRLPRQLAIYIAARAARALAYAHSRKDNRNRPLNIIHCDICPHNILINREGVPKLTDFGIARAATIQSSDHVSGKLAFMSPEQYNDPQRVTFASDIYSLGVVLFYMLCNHYSRDVHADRQGVIQQIRCNYINWEALPDDLPDDLQKILQKMLEFDPACRYRDCHELVQVLEYYIYRDGYGPTMVTLSKYMHEFMPGYFGKNSGKKNNAPLPAPESLERYQVSTEL